MTRFLKKLVLVGLICGLPAFLSAQSLVAGQLMNWDADNTAVKLSAELKNYPISSDWVQQAYLKPSNIASSNQFGYTVSISGDTAAVGAPAENSDTGAVYIFTRSAGVWTQQARLTASNASVGTIFGVSVALSGDTLAIGSQYESTSVTGSGAAYVFTRSGTTWSEQAFLKGSNLAVYGQLGESVALSGDTLVVGAPGSGLVYVFTRSGTTWSEAAILQSTPLLIGIRFGWAVAISGDTIAVGADFEDSSKGAVYIFTGSGSSWSQQARLADSTAAADDHFGFSLDLLGDTLIVGAFGRDIAAPLSGAVYKFTRSGTSWTQTDYLTATDTLFFGYSVAMSSSDMVFIGSPGNNAAQGAVYLYDKTCKDASEDPVMIVSTPVDDGDQFAFSMAVYGDSLLVGANLEDSASSDPNDNSIRSAGAAYIFNHSNAASPCDGGAAGKAKAIPSLTIVMLVFAGVILLIVSIGYLRRVNDLS